MGAAQGGGNDDALIYSRANRQRLSMDLGLEWVYLCSLIAAIVKYGSDEGTHYVLHVTTLCRLLVYM